MVIVNRKMLHLMIPSDIYKVTEDEARVMIRGDNWNQPVVLQRGDVSPEEWALTVKIDTDSIMRRVSIGSVQSGDGLVIMDGTSRICIHGVWLSSGRYFAAND